MELPNFITANRHKLCRDVAWWYPHMALFVSMRDRLFRLTCKECGHIVWERGQEIRQAVESHEASERQEKRTLTPEESDQWIRALVELSNWEPPHA